MIKFDIKDGLLTISPEVLTINVFNEIWMHDKSRSKSKASNMLVYVFHMCDITDDNFMRDVPSEQRDPLAKKNAFGNENHKFTDEEQDMIDRAMAWYEVLNKNSVMRLSVALDKKIDEITEFYDSNKITSTTDLDKQTNSMNKLDKILKAKKLADDYAKYQTEKKRVKGGSELSPLEEGAFRKKKK